MVNKTAIEQAFAALIADTRDALKKSGWNGRKYAGEFPAVDAYFRVRTEALNLVRRACGADSDHYAQLQRLASDAQSASNSFYLPHMLGTVEAAQRDFAAGRLFDLRAMVAAELLGDFMEQAKALLDAGYHVAAVSVAGAVLEDSLRALCRKVQIDVPPHTKLDRLNADLAKAGVYELGVQKRITQIADVRNNADHGHFAKVSKDDAEDAVKWVNRFVLDHVV